VTAHPPRSVAGYTVHPVGLGAMPLSLTARPARADALRVLHVALDAGVRLVDTADAYSVSAADVGHNEELVADALRRWGGERGAVLVATKGGHVRGPDGSWGVDGRPAHLRGACEASLRRLGVEAIGLYQFHRPDPAVPFVESVGAIAELADEGKVVAVGLSNVTAEQIDAARALVPVASVQNEFGPHFRSSVDELRHCEAAGIAFLPWAPLGGAGEAGRLGARHPAFAQVAARYGVSAQRVALAWALAQGSHVVPIPGARRPATALDSIAAAELVLAPDDVALLDAAG
jgi:aryl-alcohol dehydrogenase-like predicted oxidoreductase